MTMTGMVEVEADSEVATGGVLKRPPSDINERVILFPILVYTFVTRDRSYTKI